MWREKRKEIRKQTMTAMKIRKKEISMEQNAEVMKKLTETKMAAPEKVSLRRYIDINFEVFTQSGKTTREIYEFLKRENIDVSSFQVFKSLYSRVKRSRLQKSESPANASIPVKSASVPKRHAANETAPKPQPKSETQPESRWSGKSQYYPTLPPVYLPGGVEAIIDPETGAKRFEIKSAKDSERITSPPSAQ
ncbi:MAG: hypothetical protein LBH75_06205 [Treponema sp.]|jgi:hypothetical protein|nr:hypothetical protein [Treponema sp.]